MKQVNKTNWRVEVYARDQIWSGKDGDKLTADDIAKAIRRHCDNVAQAVVVCDYEPVCSHCGSRWTEDSKIYNGGCCDKDEANNPEEQGDDER